MNHSTSPNSNRNPLASSWIGRLNTGLAAIALSAMVASSAHALVETMNSLTIAPGGVLNIKNNNVVVTSGNMGALVGATYTGISGYLQTGLLNGPNVYWDGPGINSSVAANETLTAVGIASNTDQQYATWPPLTPVAVGANAVLIKYTWLGDTNLDGVVDVDFDYGNFILGLTNSVPAAWQYGDFNYDGVVDQDFDYGDFLLGLLGQTGPLASQGSSAAASVQVVPEPSSIGLVAVAALGILSRRNRKSAAAR